MTFAVDLNKSSQGRWHSASSVCFLSSLVHVPAQFSQATDALGSRHGYYRAAGNDWWHRRNHTPTPASRRPAAHFMTTILPTDTLPAGAVALPPLLLTYDTLTTGLTNDVLLTAAIGVGVTLWLLLWQRLTALHVVPSVATRKVIHISCGPAFVALWPLYSDSMSGRLLAASVPLAFSVVLVLSGSAPASSKRRTALGRAISRGGEATEALQGPLFYSGVLLVCTLVLFKSAAAVVAIMQMCFGDGFAEVFGRKFGTMTQWGLPWTGRKSVAGSAAFLVAGLGGSLAALQWMYWWQCTDVDVNNVESFAALLGISAACASFELAPREIVGDDNLVISVVAAALTILYYGQHAL